MHLRGRVAVVTGGAHGIGAAMARRFAAEGARAVVVADLDLPGAEAVAADARRLGAAALATRTDVGRAGEVEALVSAVLAAYGEVDLFCSNAGLASGQGVEATRGAWDALWRVNVLAHVAAARAVLPSMLARGEGYLLQTCSAAGLLSSPGDAPYAVTKHAAVSLAEWLALTYGDRGIRVSALCPMGVRTAMLLDAVDAGAAAAAAVTAAGAVLEPEQVAEAVVAGLAAERFLILPHPEVADLAAAKARDVQAWVPGAGPAGP